MVSRVSISPRTKSQTSCRSAWKAGRTITSFSGSERQCVGPVLSRNAAGGGDLGTVPTGHLTEIPVFAPASLVFFTVSGEVWAASENRFAVVLPATTSQVHATGNQARTGQATLNAMVSLVDSAAQAMTFANNQIGQESGGGGSEIVLVGAPAPTASGNHVMHSTDALSMRIVTAPNGQAAVLGNVTRAGIAVVPNGIGAAFAPLNINV